MTMTFPNAEIYSVKDGQLTAHCVAVLNCKDKAETARAIKFDYLPETTLVIAVYDYKDGEVWGTGFVVVQGDESDLPQDQWDVLVGQHQDSYPLPEELPAFSERYVHNHPIKIETLKQKTTKEGLIAVYGYCVEEDLFAVRLSSKSGLVCQIPCMASRERALSVFANIN